MMNYDWQTNIENYAMMVVEEYGTGVVDSVFTRYDATCFEDLSPAFYSEVFSDLQMIAEDK